VRDLRHAESGVRLRSTEIELPIGKIPEQALYRCRATAKRGVRV
jgi:hypothetical protein